MDQVKLEEPKILQPQDLLRYGKRVKKFIKSNTKILRQWQFREIRLLKLEKNILSQGDFEQVIPLVEQWWASQYFSNSISFREIYPVKINLDDICIFTDLDFDNANPLDIFSFLFLVSIVNNYLELFTLKPEINAELFELAFNHMTYPMAIIGEDESVIIHTQRFSALNVPIKECLKYPSGHKFVLPQGLFQMTKKKLEDGHVVFFRENKVQKGMGQDLGIVTSSLAHELNNPIAGILAALGLLELSENESQLFHDEIKEMKSACWRCKELVDIFLGFSRAKPGGLKNSDNAFELVVQHAVRLVRFRLIEMNLNMDLDFRAKNKVEHSYNSSVLTMIVYLVLGEILTEYNHFLLISSHHKKDFKRVEIKINEYKNSFMIGVSPEIVVSKNWRNFHLVQSLLDYEHISLNIDAKKNCFEFSWQDQY